MADYFTNLSVVFKLPNEAALIYALDLATQAGRAHQGDELPEHFPACLKRAVEDWQFEAEAGRSANGWALWLHSYHGGLEAAFVFIQHLLKKFDRQGRVTLEWSHDCSKPRVDAYGGGAAIITARKIKTMSTGGWLQRHAA